MCPMKAYLNNNHGTDFSSCWWACNQVRTGTCMFTAQRLQRKLMPQNHQFYWHWQRCSSYLCLHGCFVALKSQKVPCSIPVLDKSILSSLYVVLACGWLLCPPFNEIMPRIVLWTMMGEMQRTTFPTIYSYIIEFTYTTEQQPSVFSYLHNTILSTYASLYT